MNAPDLHVHSTYSTYDGMGSPKAVVARAKELGWGAVALTEHGWLGSAPALYQAAKKEGIKPIIGCELYVTPEESLIDGDKDVLKDNRHLTVLALSFEGYQNLVRWVSLSYERPCYYNGPRISLDRMIESAPHGLHHNVVLSGCLGGELCQCLLHMNGTSEFAALNLLASMSTAFPNFYIELQNHGLGKFMDRGMTNYQQMVEAQGLVRDRLLQLAKQTEIPVVVTNDSHFQSQDQRRAHLAMMARKQSRRARGAHEEQTTEGVAETFGAQYIYWTSYMRSMEKIAATLPTWAEKQSIQSIHEIVDEADVVIEPLDKFSYTIPRSGYDDPVAEVRRRSKSKLKSMIARHGQVAADRFEYELGAMKDFADYLCLEADIVKMSRESGIYSWTRGSAANSLVAYCLGIHRIDPIHYRLMFERFVNPARTKLPDVDIDFEAHRRDDVAKMVVEHMAELEGDGNVRAICTYSTVSNRSAFRLIAAAHGVPEEKIDQYAKLLPQMIDSGMVGSDEEAYEMLADELGIDIHGEASQVFDAIGNISQHACAYVLGTEERPLAVWVPDYLIGSSNARVTQYNMKSIEDMGFLKLDLLKLDTLSIMHTVARMLGKDMSWLDSLAESEPGVYELDEDTMAMLRAGRTEGVHSMQGGTQRRGCIEVGVESVEDLIAVQGLYRPSGTRTGLDKAFVNRKHGREEWESINEFVGQYLDETYGIAIFQEQIMEMGAGLGMSGEEIDDLYKAIKTAKGTGRGAKELFEAFEPTFRKYADKQMPQTEADELWAEWEKLQGYTFNRGHATSYAILAAKTAYLRCHHPQEFFTALLDRYPNNPRYLAAAMAEGYRFEAPDVNASGGGFTKGSDDKSIRIGLSRVKGIGPAAVQQIAANQPFASLADLRERTSTQQLKQPGIDALIAVGALESLGIAGEGNDLLDFQLMKFIPRTPKVFKDITIKLPRRGDGKWKFLGLQHSVQITEGKAFCAKLFWIPPLGEDIFTTKTSPSGRWSAHLLTVVDENGIPFDIQVSTDKKVESKLLKLLHRQAQGAVICAEGQVKMPFDRGLNTGFSLWGIVGAEDNKPHIWQCSDKELPKMLVHLAQEKRAQRSR